MHRIIVAGGFGFFGRGIVEMLREAGFSPRIGSRRTQADIVVDVEDDESIRHAFRRGDIVIDAVGPFQQRTTRLVQAAIELQFNVIDLADSLDYVSAVYGLRDRIDAAGIRVVTACSGISSISAAAIQLSGTDQPERLTGFLVPATRVTAVPGTAASLFCSVGKAIRVLESGALEYRRGWMSTRDFPMPAPVGTRTGYLFESADAITLPAVWPSLQCVEFYVDTNVRGLNVVFSWAARSSLLRELVDKLQRPGVRFSRWLGRPVGGLGYEVESANGHITRLTFTATRRGYVTALAPTFLAAKRLASDEFPDCGLIPPNRHVIPDDLIQFVVQHGVTVTIGP